MPRILPNSSEALQALVGEIDRDHGLLLQAHEQLKQQLADARATIARWRPLIEKGIAIWRADQERERLHAGYAAEASALARVEGR